MGDQPGAGSVWPAARSTADHPLAALPLRDWIPRRAAAAEQTSIARPAYDVVDAHNHLGRWLTGDWSVPDPVRLVDLMDGLAVTCLVNLDGRWGAELEANLDRYDRRWPSRFATFAHADWSVLAEQRSGVVVAQTLAAGLRRCASTGARGLKVWKDLGLHVRDAAGAIVLPDDPRLDELFETAGELALPVFVHTADPVAFFDPLDEHNERLEQLLAYPDWSFADRERFPSFGQLVEALEARVARHPTVTFVGVHFGCHAEDPRNVARMLRTYPNYHVDIAARVAELGRQPRAVRAVIEEFPDRVLFGTDAFPPSAEVYRDHFHFLESWDECFDHEPDQPPLMGRWTISGLGLAGETLRAVYSGNAHRLLGVAPEAAR